jgi:hypothetical protein
VAILENQVFLIMTKKYLSIAPRNSLRSIACLIILTVCIFRSEAQSDELKGLRTEFEVFSRTYLQERIYVHSDKDYYTAGEILWFKVYNMEKASHELLDLSRIAYVDILDKDKKPVFQGKIALEKGLGSGSFFIPYTVRSGNYLLRGYTNWMKNFGPEGFFQKPITIINPTKKLGLAQNADSLASDIEFFPEGGNLVYGLESKVGFKAIDQDGKAFDFEGLLTNQKGDTVVRFKPLKFGMGSFIFTPEAGNNYLVHILKTDGSVEKPSLPAIYQTGYVMRVARSSRGYLSVTVRASNDNTNLPVYLIAHDNHNIISARAKLLRAGLAEFEISSDSLKEGMNFFTLFNEEKHPICERLWFIRPAPPLMITAKTEKQEYSRRTKVDLNILSYDSTGQGLPAHLSLSVYRIDSLQHPDPASLYNYIWLTGELRGEVDSPEYYFQAGDQAEEATENLLLTQGWRRFNWDPARITDSKLLEFAPELQGHLVRARVVNKVTGKPAEGVLAYLSVPSAHFQLEAAVSNSEGLLVFNVKSFYGADDIALQAAEPSDSNDRIDILDPFSEKYSFVSEPVFEPRPGISANLIRESIHVQAENIYSYKGLQKLQGWDPKDSTAFYGKPDQSYMLDDYTRFNTMEEVMREYIASILVKKRQGHFYYRVLNYPYKIFFDTDPLVLFDGVPVHDLDKIITFDPLKVRKIELMNRKYFLGSAVFDGIISYTTYQGDLAGFSFDPNVIVLKYDGLQLQRNFYSPVYETKEQVQSRIPDFRKQLCWVPEINTDTNGNGKAVFYTSDETGTFLISLQGITSQGRAGGSLGFFRVDK